MKKIAVALLVVAGLALITGCGSSNSTSGNINGNWTASLTDTGGTVLYGFTTSLTVNNGGTLVVGNFQFSNNSSCFVSGETESGSFVASGDFNGNVMGSLLFTITSGNPSGNTLTLKGTANGNTIMGTWMLTGGTGCTGTGNFTWTKT
jgi:hypothetical protein